MTDYVDLELALHVAATAIGSDPQVADYGLLESALARPRATVMGEDAYPSLLGKAAALLHSLLRNHSLVDGNKRLAWHVTVVFCYINDVWIVAPEDDAYDFVIAVAAGRIGEVPTIAATLQRWSRPV